MKKIIILVLLFLPAAVLAEEKPGIDIRDKMTMREFTEAGLDKLSPQEVDALNKWLNSYMAGEEKGQATEGEEKTGAETKKREGSFLGSLFGGPKFKKYKIEEIESDHRFKINKNYFTSTSLCPGYAEGDEVIFTDGMANGMCDSAEFSRPDGSGSCVVFCR